MINDSDLWPLYSSNTRLHQRDSRFQMEGLTNSQASGMQRSY